MMSEALQLLSSGKANDTWSKNAEFLELRRKPLLTFEQEGELGARILKLSRSELPLTPKSVRRSFGNKQ
ncbi:unnamed protein product [Acanthoscelides obtectus]|uniref:Uncharacterized protein n=1 Tax=Acanthoscelides obtectus TaxID=200917 RepID=A0A9P0PC60_ACAOB|nr:unnamed protein product [Acanthoscelides obtectus]CAK1641858.1 hypothetical protein AOBTE_LOCUS12684 [Acanthoscelides obtectus]